jgi:hypothetical protein
MKLQGNGKNISHLVGHFEGFRKKLKLFEDALQKLYDAFSIMPRIEAK